MAEAATPLPAAATTKRALCESCLRPLNVCICEYRPSPLTKRWSLGGLNLTILQHQTEHKKKKTVGTVPLVPLILSNSSLSLHVGESFTRDVVNAEQSSSDSVPNDEVEKHTLILFPGEGSVSVDEYASAVVKKRGQNWSGNYRVQLIVIDGTWAQAKSINRKCEWISEMVQGGSAQRVHISGVGTSSYTRHKVRKEESEWGLSTVDAIVHAMRQLAPMLNNADQTSTFESMQALWELQEGMLSKTGRVREEGYREQYGENGRPERKRQSGNKDCGPTKRRSCDEVSKSTKPKSNVLLRSDRGWIVCKARTDVDRSVILWPPGVNASSIATMKVPMKVNVVFANRYKVSEWVTAINKESGAVRGERLSFYKVSQVILAFHNQGGRHVLDEEVDKVMEQFIDQKDKEEIQSAFQNLEASKNQNPKFTYEFVTHRLDDDITWHPL